MRTNYLRLPLRGSLSEVERQRSNLPYQLVMFLAACFLAACSPATTSAAVPTPIHVPASPLDGAWQGVGFSADGKEFQISFEIQNSKFVGIQYAFNGKDNILCTNLAYVRLAEAVQPRIEDSSLKASFADLKLSIVFESNASASGHLSARSYDRYGRCSGEFELDWTATKQAVQGVRSVEPHKPIRPHPFQAFLQILIFGLSNGSVLALNAIGVTLIYSTVRTLNLAHGDVFALTSVFVTSLVNSIGISQNWLPLQLAGALLIVLAAAAGFGTLLSVGVEQLAFKPFRGRSRLAPLIATLGLSFILYQGALVWRTFQGSWIPGEHRSVPGLPEVPTDGIPNLLPEINLTQAMGLPWQLVVRFADVFVLAMAILFVILATWFLQKTRTGRAIRALSQSQQAAQLVGVDVDRTIRRAFAVGGALAGGAAFIFALYYSRPFGAHGAQSGLLAFAAALLGGIGSPAGALVSGLLIGVFSSLSDYYLSAQWTPILLLILLLILLTWRPTGLTASGGESSVLLSAESTTLRDSIILTGPIRSRGSRRWLVLLLIIFGLLPLLLQTFELSGQVILLDIGVFILLALGLNLALGLAGLLDLGFAASFGFGAYAAALLSQFNFLLGLSAGALAGGLLGWIKGGLARRIRGDFLAVATLTLGLLAQRLIVNLGAWTGGTGGLSGFPAPHFLGLSLSTPIMKFYLVFGFVLLAAWTVSRLGASRTGRDWMACGEDESAALASGVDVGGSRVRALVLSSLLAGMAGALFAVTFSYIDPEITMSFHVSSMILTMVILGGAGNISGAIMGAALIVLYDKVIVTQIAGLLSLIWPADLAIGSAPDIRGASFFNFGIALYLTVLLRAHRRRT